MATQQNITWAFDSKFGEWRCNRLATVCIIEFSGGYCVETPRGTRFTGATLAEAKGFIEANLL